MALSFTRLSWLWMGGKDKEQVSNGSVINSINSLGEWGLGLRGEAENLKFYNMKSGDGRMRSSSSNRKSKRKWKSREERSRRIDKEYDVVLVPSDGVGLSGSESEDSDWSIGWMEPHAPGFKTDDEGDDSFAVLVPCYRHDCRALEAKEDVHSIQFLGVVKDLPNGFAAAGGREHVEQWLSSLQNFESRVFRDLCHSRFISERSNFSSHHANLEVTLVYIQFLKCSEVTTAILLHCLFLEIIFSIQQMFQISCSYVEIEICRGMVLLLEKGSQF